MSKAATRLVYHPAPTVRSTEFERAIREVLDAASVGSRILAVSPYIGTEIIRSLVRERPFRIITDIEACFESGHGESLSAFFMTNLASVRSLKDVHAKVVLSDHAAFLGSANLTDRGFRVRDEMGCVLLDQFIVQELHLWFEALWQRSAAIDDVVLRDAMERGRRLVGARPVEAGIVLPQPYLVPSRRRTVGWMGLHVKPQQDVQAMENDPSAEEDLVAQVRTLSTSRDQAALILRLLGESLDVSGLTLDDPNLHLNFGKGNPLSVTVGGRFVAWCSKSEGKRVPAFGFILDDPRVGEEASRLLPGAWTDHFSKNRAADAPTLHVPPDVLDLVPLSVIKDWRKGILKEVDRRNTNGSVPTSPYRGKTRPYLFTILTDSSLAEDLVIKAFPRRWWLGVSNEAKGHRTLSQIRPFLEGHKREFAWSVHGSTHSRFYRLMRAGDAVLIWTGHGSDPRWGILGSAVVSAVRTEDVLLSDPHPFSSPITPYPKDEAKPPATSEVNFLSSVFGRDYTPLGDVFHAVWSTPARNPATVFPVHDSAFEEVIRYGDSR